MMFFHHENPHEATNGFVKAVILQIFSKFSNVKFSPHCVPDRILPRFNILFYPYSTPLTVASEKGQLEIVKCLIQNGALINLKMELDGSTSLHYATNYGKYKL